MIVVFVILVVSVLLAPIVSAAEFERGTFTDSTGCYIKMTGEIKDEDAQMIVNLMEDDTCATGKTTALEITSGGGSAKGGRHVADVIKFYGLNTMVAAKEGMAVSAGFSILMSGKEVYIYENAMIGHHSPWIPEFSYNSFYVGKKPVAPYTHNLHGQKMIVDSIEQDIGTVPAWLIVKYITKIQGEVYWLTPVDLLKLHKEGWIKLLKAEK